MYCQQHHSLLQLLNPQRNSLPIKLLRIFAAFLHSPNNATLTPLLIPPPLLSTVPFKLVGIGELTADEMPEAKLLIFFMVFRFSIEKRDKRKNKKSLACLVVKYQRVNNLTPQQERHCMVSHIGFNSYSIPRDASWYAACICSCWHIAKYLLVCFSSRYTSFTFFCINNHPTYVMIGMISSQ